MGKNIFVSYSSADEQIAKQLVFGLEKRGLSCWIAPRDIPLSHAYGPEIVKGIREAQNFLLVLSRKSAASSDVAREVELAARNSKPIGWLRIDDTDFGLLEYHISSPQGQDMGVLTDERFDELARRFRSEDAPAATLDGARLTGVRESPRPPGPRNYWIAGAVAFAGVIGGLGWLGWPHSQPATPAKTTSPIILEFKTDSVEVSAGDKVELAWKTENAKSVRIEPLNRGRFGPEGTLVDRPQSTQTYTLVATDVTGQEAMEKLTVRVTAKPEEVKPVKPRPTRTDPPSTVQLPVIASFQATPTSVVKGERVLVSWEVKNAVTVGLTFEPGNGSPSGAVNRDAPHTGSARVVPRGGGDFVLTAIGTDGRRAERRVAVRVAPGN